MFYRLARIVRGQGSFAISMSSVSTPVHFLSSWVTSLAACSLIRPILAVPRITGMYKLRLESINMLPLKRSPRH